MSIQQYTARAKADYSSISVRVLAQVKKDFYDVLNAEGVTPYKFLQDIIKQKISDKAVGVLVSYRFEYKADRDSFDWIGLVDGGSKRVIVSDLEPQAVEMLSRSIGEGLKIRANFKEGRKIASMGSLASGAKARLKK